MDDRATTYSLIYTSKTHESIGDVAMQAIVSAAQTKNARLGISGFLLWKNGTVVQGLLGSRNTVESLFLDIKHDTRHHQVALLYDELGQDMAYPDWPLKFIDMNRYAVSADDWKIINTGIPEHLRTIMFGAL